ncbi:hypothetical protein [Brevundimonas sp.]|uniref:hypothetical protein n=1 Tax=Brevundimonas sp. TaxID=1871086 RepID=UPI0028A24B8A|nr:hypothetical protein [Brevundimonas sp.]
MKINIEKISVLIGISVTLFTVGGAWTSMNFSIKSVERQIEDLNSKLDNDVCKIIISRQVLAVDSRNEKAKNELKKLSHEHSCIKNYNTNIIVTGSRTTQKQSRAEILAERRKRQEAFEQEIAYIDELLDIHSQ